MISMMPRFLRAPVVSDKHEVTWSQIGIDNSAVFTVVLSRGKKIADVNTSTEVPVGSKIYGIYLEFQFSAQDITTTKIVHWAVQVEAPNQTKTVPSLYYQDDRSYIIKRGMEMIPKNAGTVIKRVIFVKIPRIYQRQKDEQDINFSFISTDASLMNACGFAIYKSIS